jgi:hypothetical protein
VAPTADDAAVTARALENAGADLLVLSGGRNVESTWFMFGSLVDQQEIARMLRRPVAVAPGDQRSARSPRHAR